MHVVTIVDFCQNDQLPSHKKDQPGETYFFVPLNIYVLGIVAATVWNIIFMHICILKQRVEKLVIQWRHWSWSICSTNDYWMKDNGISLWLYNGQLYRSEWEQSYNPSCSLYNNEKGLWESMYSLPCCWAYKEYSGKIV